MDAAAAALIAAVIGGPPPNLHEITPEQDAQCSAIFEIASKHSLNQVVVPQAVRFERFSNLEMERAKKLGAKDPAVAYEKVRQYYYWGFKDNQRGIEDSFNSDLSFCITALQNRGFVF